MEAGTGGQEPRGVNAGERGSTHRRKGVKPRCRDPQGTPGPGASTRLKMGIFLYYLSL